MNNDILRAANTADLVKLVSVHAKVFKDGDRWKACCPFHQEKTPSFIITRNGKYRFRCFGCGESGDAVDFVAKINGVTQLQAARMILAGTNGAIVDFRAVEKKPEVFYKRLYWPMYVSRFHIHRMRELCRWRGYSVGFVEWLKGQELIGCYNGAFAFPIRQNGNVVRLHCRTPSGWMYYPRVGARTDAMIIGNGDEAHLFESQWDLMACMDASGYRHNPRGAWIATRGASNSSKLAPIAGRFKKLFLYKQADAASDKWATDISAQLSNCMIVGAPAGFKDWNDAIKAGAEFSSQT